MRRDSRLLRARRSAAAAPHPAGLAGFDAAVPRLLTLAASLLLLLVARAPIASAPISRAQVGDPGARPLYLPWVSSTRPAAALARCGAHASWESFTHEDGLSHPYVHAMAIDAERGVWFKSATGPVVRRSADGAWTTFRPREDGVPADMVDVDRMAAGDDGRVWFAPNGARLVEWRPGGTWVVHQDADIAGRVDGDVEDIAIDRDGRLWLAASLDFAPHMGARRGGAVAFDPDGGAWTHSEGSWPVFEEDVLAVAFDAAGDAWFGMFDGVARRAVDGTWTTWRADSGAEAPTDSDAEWPTNVRAIAFDASGNGWFGTAGRGIFVRDRDGEWDRPRDLSFLDGVRVWDLAVDAADQVWIASTEGAICVAPNGSVTRHTAAVGGLVHDEVHALAADPSGAMWFATQGGASVARPPHPSASGEAPGPATTRTP